MRWIAAAISVTLLTHCGVAADFILLERRLEGAYRVFWLSEKTLQFYQIEGDRVTIWSEAASTRDLAGLWASLPRVIKSTGRGGSPAGGASARLAEQDEVSVHGRFRGSAISKACPDRSRCSSVINDFVDDLEMTAAGAPAVVGNPKTVCRAFDMTWESDPVERARAAGGPAPTLDPSILRAVTEPGRLIPIMDSRAGTARLANQIVTFDGRTFRLESFGVRLAR